MPTRISAGVGDHPSFLTLYNYDPDRLQNNKFFLRLVCIGLIIIESEELLSFNCGAYFPKS